MIHAEPAGVRKKQPYQDDEAKYLREIKKISKPADQRRCFDISNCGGRNSHNHYSAEHHTCERYHSSSDKKQAENEFYRRNKKAFNSGKGICASQSVWPHLFPALIHKEFASPREEEKREKRTDHPPCQENCDPPPCVQLHKKEPDARHDQKVNRQFTNRQQIRNAFARSDHRHLRQRWNNILFEFSDLQFDEHEKQRNLQRHR